MRLPGRAPHVPADVVARLELSRGESVLASAATDDGTWLLGTRLALHVVAPHEVTRIGWEQVENAGWDVDSAVLEVSEVGDWERPRPVHRYTIAAPGRLLELLRERVSATVLLQRRVMVGNGLGFAVHARRSPADDSVAWLVAYDDGVDPAAVRDRVDDALARARAEVEV